MLHGTKLQLGCSRSVFFSLKNFSYTFLTGILQRYINNSTTAELFWLYLSTPSYKVILTLQKRIVTLYSILFNYFVLQMFYYLAIVEDFILRFFWVITFLLQENGLVSSELISSVTAPLEIFRYNSLNTFLSKQYLLYTCKTVPKISFLARFVPFFVLRSLFNFELTRFYRFFRSNRDLFSRDFICRRFVWNFFRLENEHLNNCGKFRAVRDICIAPIAPSDPLEVIRMMDEDDGVINRSRRRPLPSYLRKSTKEEQKLLMADEMNNMHVTLSSM